LEFLDAAMFSYNIAYHEKTKISPYELIFGKRLRLPSIPRITIGDHLQGISNKFN